MKRGRDEDETVTKLPRPPAVLVSCTLAMGAVEGQALASPCTTPQT